MLADEPLCVSHLSIRFLCRFRTLWIAGNLLDFSLRQRRVTPLGILAQKGYEKCFLGHPLTPERPCNPTQGRVPLAFWKMP
jgi:hypothetical protein